MMEYKGLVHMLARKYCCKGASFEDLVQEGYIGVIKAKQKYDTSCGTSPNTYTSMWVKSCMFNYLKAYKKQVRSTSAYIEEFTTGTPFKESKEEATRLLNSLPASVTKNVIYSRYFRGDTLTDLGKVYQVSKERIYQIEKKGLNKLKRNAQNA